MIVLSRVSKQFDGKKVLKPITLTLKECQTHVLLGSSGCGKSTLLRMILGLLPYDSGNIQLQNIHVTPEAQPQVALQVGYVIQEGGLFPHLTAKDNVSLSASVRGWSNKKIDSRLWELSELVQLEKPLLQKYPKELSGGQRQRVGLMRALMLDPTTLFLDEPLGALDPIVRFGLQEELKRIFNSLKKTVVIVTHDIGEAAFFGHTITLLHEGEMIQHGTFFDLVKNPASRFVTEFLSAQRPPPELRELL